MNNLVEAVKENNIEEIHGICRHEFDIFSFNVEKYDCNKFEYSNDKIKLMYIAMDNNNPTDTHDITKFKKVFNNHIRLYYKNDEIIILQILKYRDSENFEKIFNDVNTIPLNTILLRDIIVEQILYESDEMNNIRAISTGQVYLNKNL